MNNTSPAKTIKLLTWLVVILLVANIATLAVIWIRPHLQPEQKLNITHDHNRYKEREVCMIKDLSLDSMQVDFYNTSKKEFRKQMKDYRLKIEQNKAKINEQLFSQNPDTMEINRLNDSISHWTVIMEKERFDHLLRVKKILKPEQLTKFREVFEPDDQHCGKREKKPERHSRE